MEETSALHTALGLLPPAVVIDSLRYVSARPPPKTTPQDHIRRLIKESREIGAEQFVARLKKPTQAALLSDLVDVEEDEDDVADRLEKELKKDLASSDPSATFKQVNGKVVKACATELMLDPSQDLEDLRALLVDEIILTGMETLFTILPRSVLDQYCAHWKLERTGGKAGLVARLLAHLFDLDLDDQVEAAAAESDEPESDEMEVEAVAKSKPKKEQVVAAAKKAPVATTKKTKATKKTKKMEESDDDESDGGDDALSSSDEDDDEQEEWERSEKKKKLAKRPADGKRPLAEPIVNPSAAAKATKTGKRPDLATSRAMSPRTPAAKPAQKKAPAKKTLQLPDDMHELNVDMKESMIVRKYKIDQLRQCLKMNGLSEVGLKAALAARLHLHMLEVARQSDEENADPNCMED